MGLDWERVKGEGGAYLVERAAEVQQSGRLSPTALRLVVEEAQRLRFLLTEEIARLKPEGDLTEGAIAALRTQYQTRLDAAERVIAAAHGFEAAPTMPPPQPSPARGGRVMSAPTLPSPTVGGERAGLPRVPSGGGEVGRKQFSWREFLAERSILILSYIGAFLLIVATLLFELSAFTAVDSTARFAGVLVLNLIFGLAGWICFRLPAMRLVGRTYIAIAALMVPLTIAAAWVFLLLDQHGISRDLAITIGGAACALLYGTLAYFLESEGYAALSLFAMAIAWGAGVDMVDAGRWRGTLLVPMVALYLVIAHGFTELRKVHTVFSRFANIALHLGAAVVVAWTLGFLAVNGIDWTVATVNAAELTIVYIAYAVLARSGTGGAGAMALFAATWVAALQLVDLEPLTGLLLTPLIAVYILATYRSHRIPGVDVVFATHGELFIHGATVLALGWTLHSGGNTSLSQAWILVAASLAVVAFLYAWFATLSARRYGGLAAMIALGLAWLCLLNGIEIWPWRGLAFTPVMAFYIVVASRRPVIRDLFASEPEGLITGAAGIAAAWAIYATASSTDVAIGSAWYPTAATLGVIALLYGLDAKLRGDGLSPALSLGALAGAWIAGSQALELRDWSGLAMTPLAVLLSVVAFRGDRLGSTGKAFARWAEPFVHAVALIAIAWGSVPLLRSTDLMAIPPHSYWYLGTTLGALTVAYVVYCWLSGQRAMQWTVAIGITLTTITLNQALALPARALAIEFLVLAIGKTVVARFYRGSRMHTFFYVTAAVQAVIAGAIPIQEEWLRASILITAAAMAVVMAVDGKRPEWLYLAGAFFTYGWYWLLKVVIPPLPNEGPNTLVLLFSPLPVLYVATAVALRRVVANRSWRLPIYAWAGAVAAGVVGLGLDEQETTILGLALLAYAVAVYVATALERVRYGVPGATVAAAVGLIKVLQGASAAPHWYPLAFTMLAWGIYAATFAWTAPDRSDWARMHRYSGLVLMAATAVACFDFPDFAVSGNPAAFAALAAAWAIALMLAVDARLHSKPEFDYLAVITAAIGTFWIARYFGAENPQWYVAGPGLALVGCGLALLADRRFKEPQGSAANGMIALGAAGLLGVTAVQTIDPTLSVSLYTGILLVESVAAVLVGIAARSRTLVLAGAAGAALASLRALVVLIEEVPLFIVFGLVAIVLLGGAAGLAVLRARFADARQAMARSWKDWT
jgi:hypothetical protein